MNGQMPRPSTEIDRISLLETFFGMLAILLVMLIGLIGFFVLIIPVYLQGLWSVWRRRARSTGP